MASWIKFDTATPNKPEVWQIASDLGIDPDAVVGKLLRVWAWFDEHTVDGNADSVTKKLLDRSVGVTGFCDAVVSSGWMLDDGATVSLPNFDRHNGQTAKNRALTAVRVANHKRFANVKGNDAGVSDALPREDKIRVDKKDQKQKHTHASRACTVTASDLIDQHKVDPQVASDFLKVRKGKRLPLTQTALDGLLREFAAKGIEPAAGFKLCAEKGWAGFKHTWDIDGGSGGANQPGGREPRSAVERVQRAIAERDAGRTFEHGSP